MKLRRDLHLECGYKCSIPLCPVQNNLEAHHINGKRNETVKENLLMLCPNHHAMVESGIIDRKACKIIKENLKGIPVSAEKFLESNRKVVREEFQRAISTWSQTKEVGGN